MSRPADMRTRIVRRIATMQSVPCITTLTGAAATVNAIRALQNECLTVRALQEYHEKIATPPV